MVGGVDYWRSAQVQAHNGKQEVGGFRDVERELEAIVD